MSRTAEATVLVTHEIGLHARPSVKLTKLAKSFPATVELALGRDGPWFDAKSIVKVMAAKAPKGSVLHLRATVRGRARPWPRWSIWSRATSTKPANMHAPLRLTGTPASAGYAEGPVFDLGGAARAYVPTGLPTAEKAALESAIAAALDRLAALAKTLEGDAAAILEFQIAMLGDDALTGPAFAAIADGVPADLAWRQVLDAEAAGYATSERGLFPRPRGRYSRHTRPGALRPGRRGRRGRP